MTVSGVLVFGPNDRLCSAPAADNNLELVIIVTGCCRKSNVNIIIEIGIDVKRFESISLISEQLVVVIRVRHMIKVSEWVDHVKGELLALSDFEVEPISADVVGVVAVVPVVVDRVADVQLSNAVVDINGGDTVTILAMPKVVIGILMIDLEQGSARLLF